MRELRIPLRIPTTGQAPAAGGIGDGHNGSTSGDRGLVQWAASVRDSSQACLLVSMDGVLIALSGSAGRLLGSSARPGVPIDRWWRELALTPGEPEPRGSLLSRTIATGSPAHSVLSLDLPGGRATVQVMAAPLQVAGSPAAALLAFMWPMSGQSAAPAPGLQVG